MVDGFRFNELFKDSALTPNPPASNKADDNQTQLGQRVREIRRETNLSIRTLAKISNLNVNTLSLIENGRTSPSVDTLQRLAHGLQVPITTFFESNQGKKKTIFQKNGSRSQTTFSCGLLEDLGAGMPQYGPEPIIVVLNPKTEYCQGPIVHTGRELVYCLEGQIAYTVDTETYFLEPGDSLFFESYLSHTWKNMDVNPSRALLVLCPRNERDSSLERHLAK